MLHLVAPFDRQDGETPTCMICYDVFSARSGSGAIEVGDTIQLGCGCLLHYRCLSSYLRNKIGSELPTLKRRIAEDKLLGVTCPFYSVNSASNTCKYIREVDMPSKYVITLAEIEYLIDMGVSNNFDCVLTVEDKNRFLLAIAGYVRHEEAQEEANPFIDATTKPCPTCGLKISHFHGHRCHHISPGSGCPGCGVDYCYKCLTSADQNLAESRPRNACKCGSWSTFCHQFKTEVDILAFLSVKPYPCDTRCGCPICNECEEGKPCAECDGSCPVCIGILNQGPKSLDQVYIPLKNPKSTNIGNEAALSALLKLREAVRVGDMSLAIAAMESSELKRDSIYNVNYREINNGEPVLHLAVKLDRLDIIRAMQENASMKLRFNVQDNDHCLPFYLACKLGRRDIVSYLLRFPAAGMNDFNGTESRMTGLMVAIEFRRVDIVQLLLSNESIDVNISNGSGISAFSKAIESRNLEILDLVLNHPCLVIDKNIGANALKLASDYEPVFNRVVSNTRVQINSLDYDGRSIIWNLRNENLLQSLLDREDIILNRRDNYGNILVAWLIDTNKFSLAAKLMRSSKININDCDRYERTALIAAVEKGNKDLVGQLVILGADVNSTDHRSKTALIHAAERGFYDIVVYLLSLGDRIDLNSQDGQGFTAAMYAIKNNFEDIVKLFLGKANLELQSNNEGMTAIMLALKSKNITLIKAMLEFVNVNAVSRQGKSVLVHAVEAGPELVDALLSNEFLLVDEKDNDGRTALIRAIAGGYVVSDKLLHRSNKNLKDNTNRNALFYAISHNKVPLVSRLVKDSTLDVNAWYVLKDSPILYAIKKNYDEIVHILLERDDILVNETDADGKHALIHYVNRYSHQHLMKDLVQRSDISILDNENKAALTHAILRNDIEMVQYLYQYNQPDINNWYRDDDNALMYCIERNYETIRDEILNKEELSVNFRDKKGATALIRACSSQRPITRQLVARSDINLIDKNNYSALFYAVQNNSFDSVQLLLEKEGLQINMKHNMYDGENNEGVTALMVSIRCKYFKITQLLLEHPGIAVNQRDDQSRSALTMAVLIRDKAVVQLLLQRNDIEINEWYRNYESGLMYCIDHNEAIIRDLYLSRDDLKTDVLDNSGRTALIRACVVDAEITRSIVSKSDVNHLDQNGYSALYYVVKKNNKASVTLLLERDDLEINLLYSGETALILSAVAKSHQLIELFIRDPLQRVDNNQTNGKGYSALFYAVTENDIDAVSLLFERNDLDLNMKYNIGSKEAPQYVTVLMISIMSKYDKITDMLLNRASIDVNVQDTLGKTALVRTVAFDQPIHLTLLSLSDIDIVDDNMNTALMIAAEVGQIDNLIKIINFINERRYFDHINLQNVIGETALMLAIRSIREQKANGKLKDDYLLCIAYLVDQLYLNPNLCNQEGKSALLFALDTQDIDIITYLIQRSDVDINQICPNERSALLYSVKMQNEELVACLFASREDLDVNLKNGTVGITALMQSVEQDKLSMIELLTKHERNGQRDLDYDVRDNYGRTALSYAIKVSKNTQRIQILKFLVPRCDVSAQDDEGTTVLILATSRKLRDLVELVAKICKEKGISPNIVDNEGVNALMRAAEQGDKTLVNYLIAYFDDLLDLDIRATGEGCVGKDAAEIGRDIGKEPLIYQAIDKHRMKMKINAKGRSRPSLDAQQNNQVSENKVPNGPNTSPVAKPLAVEKESPEPIPMDHMAVSVSVAASVTEDATAAVSTPLMEALKTKKIKEAEMLIRVLEARDSYRKTALMYAVEMSNCAAVKLLAERSGDSINFQDYEGYTALMRAADKKTRCIKCVKSILLMPNVDVSLKETRGVDAKTLCRDNPDIVKLINAYIPTRDIVDVHDK